MNGLGIYLGVILFIIGMIYFMYASQCNGKNLIMIIIALELIILSIGFILVNLSYYLDDMIGLTLTLYLLPIAGAESAIGLAFLVAYYPLRGTISFGGKVSGLTGSRRIGKLLNLVNK